MQEFFLLFILVLFALWANRSKDFKQPQQEKEEAAPQRVQPLKPFAMPLAYCAVAFLLFVGGVLPPMYNKITNKAQFLKQKRNFKANLRRSPYETLLDKEAPHIAKMLKVSGRTANALKAVAQRCEDETKKKNKIKKTLKKKLKVSQGLFYLNCGVLAGATVLLFLGGGGCNLWSGPALFLLFFGAQRPILQRLEQLWA